MCCRSFLIGDTIRVPLKQKISNRDFAETQDFPETQDFAETDRILPKRDLTTTRFCRSEIWCEILLKWDFTETRFYRNTISLKQDLAEKKKRLSDKKTTCNASLICTATRPFFTVQYTDRKWIYAEYKITAQWKFKVEGQLCNTRAIPID